MKRRPLAIAGTAVAGVIGTSCVLLGLHASVTTVSLAIDAHQADQMAARNVSSAEHNRMVAHRYEEQTKTNAVDLAQRTAELQTVAAAWSWEDRDAAIAGVKTIVDDFAREAADSRKAREEADKALRWAHDARAWSADLADDTKRAALIACLKFVLVLTAAGWSIPPYRVATGAASLLPRRSRRRYREDFQSDLFDLQAANAGGWRLRRCAWGYVWHAWELRRASNLLARASTKAADHP